jgi:hypothetical protein
MPGAAPTKQDAMSFNALTDKTSTRIVAGDGWWPDLSVGEFMGNYRLPAEYAEDMVEDHIAIARLWAVRQLAAWRAGQQAAGHASIDTVPVCGLAGEATRLFKRAVFCHAKALLLGQFVTVERREAARDAGKETPDITAMFYAWAHDAIADLLGNGRVSVGLV